MSAAKVIDWLEGLQTAHPDIAADVADMGSLYQRKLWHQLTQKIEACFGSPGFNRADLPVQLFNHFIFDFGHKINLLKLAHFAVHASKYQPNPAASVEFLNTVIAKLAEMRGVKTAEPSLFLRMHVAQFQLETGSTAEAKVLIESGKEDLARLSGVDPSVSAAVHYVASLHHKGAADFAEFYRSTLMYLSFVSSETLPEVGTPAMQAWRMHGPSRLRPNARGNPSLSSIACWHPPGCRQVIKNVHVHRTSSCV